MTRLRYFDRGFGNVPSRRKVIVRALSDGGGRAAEVKQSRAGADRHLGWSTGPDYLLVLRSRHCQTVGLVELREEAKNGLLVQNSELQVTPDRAGPPRVCSMEAVRFMLCHTRTVCDVARGCVCLVLCARREGRSTSTQSCRNSTPSRSCSA